MRFLEKFVFLRLVAFEKIFLPFSVFFFFFSYLIETILTLDIFVRHIRKISIFRVRFILYIFRRFDDWSRESLEFLKSFVKRILKKKKGKEKFRIFYGEN